MIDLSSRRQDIVSVATEIFEKFVNTPKSLRSDHKKRTGVQVLVWEPGTKNLIMISIKNPSEAAKFFVIEKAVRSDLLMDMSSKNSEDIVSMRFAGAVSILLDDFDLGYNLTDFLYASVSGLKSEEDTAIAVAILAKLTNCSFTEICNHIKLYDGCLPDWHDKRYKGYFNFLFENKF